MVRIAYLFLLLCSNLLVRSQQTEFTRGTVVHLRLHNGAVTRFNSTPGLYIAGLQVVPQVTVVPGTMRAGVIGGLFYTANRVNGLVGPTVSFRLKTYQASAFGSAGNLNLSFDHLWGTDKQKLLGGGLNVDLLNKLVLSLMIHRDYHFSNWWIQTGIGLRLSKVKKEPEPFNQ